MNEQILPPRAAPRPTLRERRNTILRTILSWSFQILVVILIAYVVVFFFGQSRTNIGQSMDVTLYGGDTVLLNVFSYQVTSPKRNDIIAFKPNGTTTGHSSSKRVSGLPGETIQIIEGIIYIDGDPYLEQRNFPVITNPGMAAEPIRLASKEFFVLGDNRNNSEDSRFADVGVVRSEFIEGKVWYVLSPSSHRGLVQ